MADPAALRRALQNIDALHRADPAQNELGYADRMEHWMGVLLGELEPLQRLAARCQHLERWALPRSDYPAGRAGYLRWRRDAQTRQAERSESLLTEAGVDADTVARVARLVGKRCPPDDADAQALEDAACLVFLEQQFADFAAQHDDDKLLDILRKTWGKMSPRAQELARGLALDGRPAELLRRALSG